MNAQIKTGSGQLSQVLDTMTSEGGFLISLLTDKEGFPIASSTAADIDPERQAAVVALIQKTAVEARNQLGFGQMDEFSLFDTNGQRLVCRPFHINGEDLILAVVIVQKHQPYRRLTNQTISSIRQNWEL